ncbi:BA75_02600T0 [Komagataella pastoris]|uniref:BA75_02600T0 n=1 Tax=Komagataella pastoris TaxID=4922 RepID=A0A1B2JDW8_PICPA|nr:BA75_02600T0 [Komagataella pastoris]
MSYTSDNKEKRKSWAVTLDNTTFDIIESQLFVNFKVSTLLAYLMMWVFIILSIAFLVSDIVTAYRLINLNRWAMDIEPFISKEICRWIFVGCIFASLAILIAKWIWAFFHRSQRICETYMNSILRNTYSIRHYSYFCIYDKIGAGGFVKRLTFFTFFSIRDCLTLLIADSPRQVINGITLFKFLRLDTGDFSTITKVISKVAEENRYAAVTLSFMTFSFILWVFFMIMLITAFLSYIPLRVYWSGRGYKDGLRQYCSLEANRVIHDFVSKRLPTELNMIKLENENQNFLPKLPDIDDDSYYDQDAYEVNSLLTTSELEVPKPIGTKNNRYMSYENPYLYTHRNLSEQESSINLNESYPYDSSSKSKSNSTTSFFGETVTKNSYRGNGYT